MNFLSRTVAMAAVHAARRGACQGSVGRARPYARLLGPVAQRRGHKLLTLLHSRSDHGLCDADLTRRPRKALRFGNASKASMLRNVSIAPVGKSEHSRSSWHADSDS